MGKHEQYTKSVIKHWS